MSSPEPTTTPTPASAATPEYPRVRVRLSGCDGNAHIIIGKVAVALRRQVGNQAADAFNAAAYQCGSYDELLQLVMRTVRVS